MTPPVVFAFADPGRRTWLALNRAGDGYHVVTPTPDDAQLITDGLRHKGQLSCSCAGGRFRGSCYVTVACEAIEADFRQSVDAVKEELDQHVITAAEAATWFDAPDGAGEEVEAFRG
jgi:ethanolamine utilization microcompartment shell protein EutS